MIRGVLLQSASNAADVLGCQHSPPLGALRSLVLRAQAGLAMARLPVCGMAFLLVGRKEKGTRTDEACVCVTVICRSEKLAKAAARIPVAHEALLHLGRRRAAGRFSRPLRCTYNISSMYL